MTCSRAARAALGGLLCLRCIDGPSLGPRPAPPDVTVSPLRAAGSARVVRLEVRVAPGVALEPSELWLFSGELSDYHLGRINRRELPETLVARQIPVLAWSSRGENENENENTVQVAPQVQLEPGARYTLAAPGLGWLAQFDVSLDDSTPLLERVWPPHGSAVGELLVFCADEVPTSSTEVSLEPGGLSVQLEPGFGELADGRACVSARLPVADAELGARVLPAEAAGFLLDPEPLWLAAFSAVEPASCAEDELELGPGCARVEDDRLSVRGAEAPLLWVLEAPSAGRVELSAPAARWLLRELEPDSLQRLSGRALSLGGVELPFDRMVHTLPERPHLVLNEVLFNAIGAEPAGEWLELVNDGGGPVELAGLWLRDSAGAVELPPATLAAGQYALLVRSDYASVGSADVAPSPGTELVRLPAWLKGGLSNAGEPLQLEDAAGAILSRFPALASRHAGMSFARSRLDAFDDEPSAFGEHAPPGASPGAVNVLVGAAP